VQDAKYSSVKDTIPAQAFVPYKQLTNIGRMNFYVRTDGDPIALLRAIPAAIKRIDPALPVENLKTLPQQVQDNIFLDRMISTMSAAFALLATILAAIGLYGVLAFSVAQRTREIGVRMALGADARKVQVMVLRQVGKLLLIGGTIGIAGAIALGKGARSILFEVSASDPLVLVSAAILLTIVAMAAGYVPALRASKIHPMQALRYE
jgi:ABC-type antimicrobial peptide transport system permease subunit